MRLFYNIFNHFKRCRPSEAYLAGLARPEIVVVTPKQA